MKSLALLGALALGLSTILSGCAPTSAPSAAAPGTTPTVSVAPTTSPATLASNFLASVGGDAQAACNQATAMDATFKATVAALPAGAVGAGVTADEQTSANAASQLCATSAGLSNPLTILPTIAIDYVEIADAVAAIKQQ